MMEVQEEEELAALKALKADHSAKTAAEEAAADYRKYSSPDFDAHSELLSVQAEVAALRDELDVRVHVVVSPSSSRSRA